MKWKELPVKGHTFDPDNSTVVRQSLIGQMQLCPGRVGYQGQEGYLEPVSEALVFGQCLHYIIGEDILSNNEQQDQLLQSMGDWVEVILNEEYDWSLSDVPNVPQFFSELSVAYRMWRNNVLPTLGELVCAEEKMQLYLGEGRSSDIWLQGTPDAVFTDALYDWKTAGRGWKNDKAQLSIQASLYMPLVKQNKGKSIRTFKFWVFNRQRGAWHMIHTQRSIAQVDAALRTAYEYGLQLEAEVYPCTPVPDASFNKKRGWYCKPKFCGAWNICEAKFLNDKVDELEIATRKW